ncbi:MAG TPA: hypothetical protein VF119_10695, partial [Candidatus Limnocylindrales bacterium]
MSTYGDSRRSIAAWLEAEAPDRAPARLVEAARARVRATPQRTPWWPARKGATRKAFARLAVAAAVVVVGAFGVVGLTQLNGPAIGPAPSHPSPRPSPAPASPTREPSTTPSGVDGEQDRQWPQRTDEELRLAQERADAGDPAYAWQIDPALDLVQGDSGPTLSENLTTPAIVDRFLREVLGWDQYLLNVREANPEQSDSGIYGLIYIRCAPGETNPLYPVADEDAPGIERCAPTSAGGSHQSVRLDITQPEGKGANGIWVVNDWAMTEPFTQLDPRLTEADVTARLEAWLAARVAGEGADGKVETEDDRGDGRCNRGLFEWMCRIADVPLLYATTAGAPYERYEIERVSGPRPPYAEMEFKVRLFADDGGTVVEQPIMWIDEQSDGRAGPKLLSLVTAMTENRRPVAV